MCLDIFLVGALYFLLRLKRNKEDLIEAKKEKEVSDRREYSQWSNLPNVILEIIFSYLSTKEKYYCSLVCKSWYQASSLPYVWSTFTLEDNDLSRSRYDFYFSEDRYTVVHDQVNDCLSKVGKRFKHLIINPMVNILYLYEFIDMVSLYNEEYQQRGIGSNIETLQFRISLLNPTLRDFTRNYRFKCSSEILMPLKRLVSNLKKLKRLILIDFLLAPDEAEYLLQSVCHLELRTLILVNATIMQHPLLHVAMFHNLYQLVISPQNLDDTAVELIGNTNLRHLHILQTRYTHLITTTITPVSTNAWMSCKKNNPLLCVHLKLDNVLDILMVWQENAPVKSILYRSLGSPIDHKEMIVINFYSKYLKIYGQLGRPKFHTSKSFRLRADRKLILLVKECPLLSTLVVTERISTATVLVLARTGRNLQRLYIRRKAVIKKCDFPSSYKLNSNWTDEFFSWLKINSRSYDLVEEEVSQILGYKWKFLSDKDFRNLNINLHNP